MQTQVHVATAAYNLPAKAARGLFSRGDAFPNGWDSTFARPAWCVRGIPWPMRLRALRRNARLLFALATKRMRKGRFLVNIALNLCTKEDCWIAKGGRQRLRL